MRHRVTGPSRRMTGNVAPRRVAQGTTGFARGAPFKYISNLCSHTPDHPRTLLRSGTSPISQAVQSSESCEFFHIDNKTK
jgi:hypothetical protein